MRPTLDEQIKFMQRKTLEPAYEPGWRLSFELAVLESLKRLKAKDEGRGQWVDTGERE